MSQEIIKVLDEFGKRFGMVIDWTSENVIPYLEYLGGRYVNWQLVSNLIWMTLCLVAIIGWSVFLHKNKEFGIERYSMINDDYFARIITSMFIYIPAGLGLIFTIFGAAECLVFPEKVILDELVSIYQSMQ